MPEISDQELNVLKGSYALLDKMVKGKNRRQVERLIKDVMPEAQTTDDVLEPVDTQLKELRKELADFKKEQEGKSLDSQLDTDIKRLKEDRDWTDEGIEKLKKMMLERQIPSIVDAADLWEHRNPPKVQEPSILSPTDWGFGKKTDDKDLELLFKDEDAWAEKTAREVWSEESKKRGQIIT